MATEVLKARTKTSQSSHRPQAAAQEIRYPQNGPAAEKKAQRGFQRHRHADEQSEWSHVE